MDDHVVLVLASALLLTFSSILLIVQWRSRAFDKKYHLDGE